MPVYVEMVKDRKTGKTIEKKINGQKQYYIRTYITDINGKKKQITRHNIEWLGRDGKKEAEWEEKRLQNDKVYDKKDIEFYKLCSDFLDEQKSINKESTYYTYYKLIHKWIIPYFPNHNTQSLCLEHFLNWRKFIYNQKLSIRMKNKCHIIMSSILNYGLKFGYLSKNYEQTLGTFKEKNEQIDKDKGNLRYITYEQFKKFISVVNDLDWKTFFTFLYYTGMRKGEVQALSWEDIDFKNKRINVTKNLTAKTFDGPYKITNTKTKENRKIDMDDYLFDIMKKYYNEKKQDSSFDISDFVFGGKKPFSRTSIDRYKHHYFQLSEINEITIHEFRHSHVSLIINEAVKSNFDMLGVFIMLSERMGHTIEVMQQTYLHLFPNIQNKVINIMNNLNK